MNNYDSVRQQVIDYSRKLADEGFLKGTGGNVSIRVAGENILAITPSNQDYKAITPDDVCVYSFEGTKIQGEMKKNQGEILENRWILKKIQGNFSKIQVKNGG